MRWLLRYFRSSIGKKQLVAVTGALSFLYVAQHLVGNLMVFGGRDALNAYAAGLGGLGVLLWAARIAFLGGFLLHIGSGVATWIGNKRARPRSYRVFRTVWTPFYARSMALSGVFIFAFVVYHVLHFTFGAIQPANFGLEDPAGRHDVYAMVVLGFQNPLVSAFYVVSMALLAMHLAHGIPSFFQTLGVRSQKYQRAFEVAGPAVAVVVFVGYTSIPLAVLLGVLEP